MGSEDRQEVEVHAFRHVLNDVGSPIVQPGFSNGLFIEGNGALEWERDCQEIVAPFPLRLKLCTIHTHENHLGRVCEARPGVASGIGTSFLTC